MGQSNYVHVTGCTIRRETDKAFLVEHPGGEDWIPKSQIADEGDNLEAGDVDVTVSMTRFIAEAKGIEGEE